MDVRAWINSLGLLCICLVSVTSAYTLEGKNVLTEFTQEETVTQGDTFVMVCRFMSIGDDYTVHFVREIVQFVHPGGTTGVETPTNITVDRLEMNPALEELENNPYSVTLQQKDDHIVYTLTITDVQPGNQGNISCIHEKLRDQSIHRKITPLIVKGPVRSVQAKVGLADGELEPWPTTYRFLTRPIIQDSYEMKLLVNYTSTYPEVAVYVKETGTMPRENMTLGGSPSSYAHSSLTVYNSPMVNIEQYTITTYTFRPEAEHNGRELVTKVHDPTGGPSTDFVMAMDVEFIPKLLDCVPRDVVAPVGTSSVQLSCNITANPTPEVTWYRGDTLEQLSEEGRFSVHNQLSGDVLTSTLTITDVLEEDHTNYYIKASNEHGVSSEYPQTTGIFVKLTASGSTRLSLSATVVILVLMRSIFMYFSC